MRDDWGQRGREVLRVAAGEAPRGAGVYFFLGEGDELLYVGKAGDLRQRLRQHAGVRVPVSRLHQRYDLVRRVAWETTVDEEAAAWREADLIFALRPPYNADPGLRATDPLGKDAPVPYVVVSEEADGRVRFHLTPDPGRHGRAYGCFPHLGKGVASRLGVACSDGYPALLRLLWAAGGEGERVPGAITRPAPASFAVVVADEVREKVHRFLAGARARLVDELFDAASERPAFMRPALRRDREAALGFFAAGPALVRARRLRHGVRARALDAGTYRRLVAAEVETLIGPVGAARSGAAPRVEG
ncbi:GIY-YIG nuclease family protein [Nonomuraea sp. NPDC049504]|uniref:GIY-YIG nuclease family protein n=1 Tax=Nonomuraea sp. NPDC049504 TaxID=3154729 RepID=UPI00343B1C74